MSEIELSQYTELFRKLSVQDSLVSCDHNDKNVGGLSI